MNNAATLVMRSSSTAPRTWATSPAATAMVSNRAWAGASSTTAIATHDSHSGGRPAFADLMRLYEREDLVIVMLANGTNLADQELADAIADFDWAPSS